MANLALSAGGIADVADALNRKPARRDDWRERQPAICGGGMTINRASVFSILHGARSRWAAREPGDGAGLHPRGRRRELR